MPVSPAIAVGAAIGAARDAGVDTLGQAHVGLAAAEEARRQAGDGATKDSLEGPRKAQPSEPKDPVALQPRPQGAKASLVAKLAGWLRLR